MNAPVHRDLFASFSALSGDPIHTFSLDDKYRLDYGQAFMSGVQALVKLPMLQQVRDRIDGKNTAGMVSGYRGSPLGGYDLALQQAEKYLKAHHIVFQPGVNEELAATALWGTQQLGFAPAGSQKYDGVFGIWYGKGPGVDRCADVFKHANMAGTTPWGGVIAVAGDDHASKSSTAAHQSDHIFKACGLPVFFPSSVQEILDLGIHAWTLSRFSGVWAGMKTIQEIVESSAAVMLDPYRVTVRLPTDFVMPPGGLHIRWPDPPLEQEARLLDYKWYAALAYIRANRLNFNVIESPNDRFGIMASGKAYNDTRQALWDLGLDDAACRRIGLRLHKVGVVWPLEAQLTREFATGLQEILVVEEKRQIIEYQLKEELYNWRADVRPNVLGKFNETESGGEWSVPNPSAHTLLRANADLNPAMIARAIAQRLFKMGVDEATRQRMEAHLQMLDAKERAMQTLIPLDKAAQRQPWFCSGCPHNTSTRVPEGSRATAGIGCHYMAIWMDRSTDGFTQMGGEGVTWVGQQPFTSEKHIFANLGDGTYFHSGLLAVRQSIAAGVNITYKILYNDAVAMTGGQWVGERPGAPHAMAASGHTVVQIAQSMRAEGVASMVIVTDDPHKYDEVVGLPEGVTIEHRDALDRIQREFRDIPGTTVIIYDQTCATEKRRRIKRGTAVASTTRLLINEAVCEGCGDCSTQSSCMSVEPLETVWGRKRQINQSSCNQDTTCIKGFCPSFVSVQGGTLRQKKATTADVTPQPDFDSVPLPTLPALAQPWAMLIAGVGGTGVITIGQLLGIAAYLEGKGIVTQDSGGLAQKGGATWSHVLIAASQDVIRTTRISMAAADLVIGCDPLVAAAPDTLMRMQSERTHVVLNQHTAPSSALIANPDWRDPTGLCQDVLAQTVQPQHLAQCDAHALATKVLGDSLFVNPIMLGFAWQHGWVPVGWDSLLRAVELNGVQIEQNKAALQWGRWAAHHPAAYQALLQPVQKVHFVKPDRTALPELVAQRVAFLTAYQNAAYAARFADTVRQVQQAEQALLGTENPARLPLTLAVARYLSKLMAYKDEYEVARLHLHSDFAKKMEQTFAGDYTLQYHLAPPGFAQKAAFGSWMRGVFRLLAPLKVLRGTALDAFGYQKERRLERAWIAEYQKTVLQTLPRLNSENYATLLAFAQLPEHIRGFGAVKQRHWQKVQPQWRALQQQLSG
jgi:indolepyruvate ferredoxin oxidoreductase